MSARILRALGPARRSVSFITGQSRSPCLGRRVEALHLNRYMRERVDLRRYMLTPSAYPMQPTARRLNACAARGHEPALDMSERT